MMILPSRTTKVFSLFTVVISGVLLVIHGVRLYSIESNSSMLIHGESVDQVLLRYYTAVFIWVIVSALLVIIGRATVLGLFSIASIVIVLLTYGLIYSEKTILLRSNDASVWFVGGTLILDLTNLSFIIVMLLRQLVLARLDLSKVIAAKNN